MLLPRAWKVVGGTSVSSLVVMQWNVLSDELCTTDSFPFSAAGILEWEARKQTLLEEIIRNSPSILALEEVDHYDDFYQPFLNDEYESVFYQKAGGKDGTVLAWKKSDFTSSEDPSFIRFSKTGSQGAIIQSLTHVESKKKILIAGTHLKAKEGFEEVRLLQVQELTKSVKEQMNGHSGCVIFGDFNDVPTSHACNHMRTCEIGLRSAYSYYSDGEIDVSYTTCKKRHPTNVTQRTIDYLWISESFSVQELLTIPTNEEIPDYLPACYYPSDHFAVAAKISW